MMNAPGLSYDELKALNPCSDRMKRVVKLMGGAKKWDGEKITAAQARKAGATFDDIVWAASALSRNDKNIERRLRLWMADCATRVLHIFEKERMTDIRPRKAIIVMRQFARGEVSAAAWVATRDAAWAAAWAAAWDSARDSAGDAAWAAAWAAAWDAARDSAGDAAWDSAWDAAWDSEQDWQFDRLVLWLSENEPNDWPLPEQPKQTQAA
jgi:hypothetical protein